MIQILAISGLSGSSGLGSVRREQIERRTLEIVRAGDHLSLRMFTQIVPSSLMLGWYIRVVNLTFGALKG